MWQIKIRKGISAVVVPPWGMRNLILHHVPQHEVPVTGREVPVTSGCENKQIVAEGDGGLMESQAVSLRGPHMGLLRLTHPELQCWGSSFWKAPKTYGKVLNILHSGQERKGQLSPSQKSRQRSLFLFWALPPVTEPLGKFHIWVSINLVNTYYPALVIPWYLTSPIFQAHPAVSPDFSTGIASLLSCFRLSWNLTNKQYIASVCPIPLAEVVCDTACWSKTSTSSFTSFGHLQAQQK